jgi:hypothetical protein
MRMPNPFSRKSWLADPSRACGCLGLRKTVFAAALSPSVRADAAASTVFTPGLLPPVRADATASTLFTLGLLPPVRADAAASTVFTQGPFLPVLADATAFTVFTLVLIPPVRADAAAFTVFTQGLIPPVDADANAATLFTLALLLPVRAAPFPFLGDFPDLGGRRWRSTYRQARTAQTTVAPHNEQPNVLCNAQTFFDRPLHPARIVQFRIVPATSVFCGRSSVLKSPV